MRIVINDLAASTSGALSVLKSIYQYVKDNDNENEFVFFVSNNYIEETDRIRVVVIPEVKKSGFHKIYFDLVSGKKILNQYHPDYVISLQNIITFGYRGKQAVYVHQAIPFQSRKNFSFLKREERVYAFYQKVVGYFIKKSIKKSDVVFVQTDWMKQAIVSRCQVSPQKVKIVPTDIHVETQYEYNYQKGCFFYPAAFENVYKNQKCIYDASEILCNKNYNDFKVFLTLDRDHKPKVGCEFIGLLDKEELYQYYSRSALVFPSFIETVGLPLAEAMSVGSVILAADCEYAHEVLSGYSNAYYFNPFEPDTLAALMEKTINGQITVQPSINVPTKTHCGWETLFDELSRK